MIMQHKKALRRIVEAAQAIKAELEQIREESQELFDEMSERKQEGAKGEKLQAEIDLLETWEENFDVSMEDFEE
jgi:hypothetical protein